MDEVAIVALAGIIATAVTAVVVPFLTARANRVADARKALESRRLELYVELNRVALREERFLERLAEPIVSQHSDDERLKLDPLTAQVRLLASAPVSWTWRTFVETRERTYWNLSEDEPQLQDADRTGYSLSRTHPDFVALSEAVEALVTTTRDDVTGSGHARWWQAWRSFS